MNKFTPFRKNIFFNTPVKKSTQKSIASPLLIGLSVLTLNACVSVPAPIKAPATNALKQQCDQRLPMVGQISTYLQKGMKNNALTKKMIKEFALPDSQQGEVSTLTYYISESLMMAQQDTSHTVSISPSEHQNAYKKWCYDSLVNGDKTAWLPDYLKKVLAE